jgi:hypothetical protein
MSTVTELVNNQDANLRLFEVVFSDASQEVLVPADSTRRSHILKSIYIEPTGNGVIEFYNSTNTSVPHIKFPMASGREFAFTDGKFPFRAGEPITVKSSVATAVGTAYIVLEVRD